MTAMKSKSKIARVSLVCGAALLGASLLRAGPYEELSRQINETAAKQFTLQTETRELHKRLEAALRDGTHDTPAMKATRAKIAGIKQQLLAAENELREQFEALPALQADIARARADRAAIDALDRQRRELLERRAKLFKRDAPAGAPAPSETPPKASAEADETPGT